MQGVLATAPLPGSPDRGFLWNDLRPAPCHHFTLVQKTEITGVLYCHHRIVTGRNSHPDCGQQLDRAHWVCECIVRVMSMANGFLQVQMDNASHCPDPTLHARDRELGKGFRVVPS